MLKATRYGMMHENDRMISYLPLSHIAAQMLDLYLPLETGVSVLFVLYPSIVVIKSLTTVNTPTTDRPTVSDLVCPTRCPQRILGSDPQGGSTDLLFRCATSL